MPNRPPRCCNHPGCPRPAYHGSLCEEHAKEQQRRQDAESPTSAQRGYGAKEQQHHQDAARPTSAQRGYGAKWQKRRTAFLRDNPFCEDCGRIATIADHVPSRRELVRLDVPDPDAVQYLHARCHSCHSRKTKAEDGGWRGRGGRSLRPAG